MKKKPTWIYKLLPSPSEKIETLDEREQNYRFFSRSFFLILLGVALTPLLLISVLSHYQYQRLLQKNEVTQMILNLEQSENTIERFVSKLQSSIRFVARDDRYEELLDPDELNALFIRLQQEYPDFVDIEVINSSGHQKAYAGPYELNGNDYSEQTWYQEVLHRGIYISNIFSGFRQVPHFVIAVRRKLPDGQGFWVLRVTIDGKTLQRYVDTGAASSLSDVYLLDADGIIQTAPRKYGRIGEHGVLHNPKNDTGFSIKDTLARYQELLLQHADVAVVRTPDGSEVLRASVDLPSTPWRLVLVNELYLHGAAWLNFKLRLFSIILGCIILSVLILRRISSGIIDYLRTSDTRRQHYLVEAENANKLASIGRLAAGVAHEINNPLSIINQKAGLVMDYFDMAGDFTYKSDMLKALDGVQESVDRCKAITHRLLGFARHTDILTEELDINLLLEDVVAFLAREATYNQIAIVFDLHADLPHLYSDRGQLQQVFLNIINNAIDAIGSNGEIIVRTSMVLENEIQVQVIDDGPGMDKEVVRHIFEPFFTTKETGKGTGLGLSITYGILKKLGGRIQVESIPGKGTNFAIILPLRCIQE